MYIDETFKNYHPPLPVIPFENIIKRKFSHRLEVDCVGNSTGNLYTVKFNQLNDYILSSNHIGVSTGNCETRFRVGGNIDFNQLDPECKDNYSLYSKALGRYVFQHLLDDSIVRARVNAINGLKLTTNQKYYIDLLYSDDVLPVADLVHAKHYKFEYELNPLYKLEGIDQITWDDDFFAVGFDRFARRTVTLTEKSTGNLLEFQKGCR
jgi:hypothetical protein